LAKNGIELSFNWEPFLEVITGLRPPKLDRPVALALVDTAKAANAKAASAIAKHTALKVADIKPKLFYDRVTIGGPWVTYVRSSRKRWPLIDFRATQTGVGVRAAKPWGKAQVFPGAFIANAGGHRGVFKRVSRKRLPIKELWGPSVHSTFKQPDVVAVVTQTIKSRLPVLLARRIKTEMRRGGKR
jgi:Prophage minor tail protein Z (GPZ)